MVFNAFWTILLGVIGGIISSLIVSRILYIQNKHQEQVNFVDHIVRRIVDMSVLLNRARAVFEASYYEDGGMKREMEENGYKTEMEFYSAHNAAKTISEINALKEDIDKKAKGIQSSILKKDPAEIGDKNLRYYLKEILAYTHEVIEVEGFSNASIDAFKERQNGLQDDYYDCVPLSGKTLAKLVFKDTCMIVLLCILALLIIVTIATKIMGV